LLDIESKVLPLVVAISGRVGAESPISCEFSGLRGVIVEETVMLNNHYLKGYNCSIDVFFFFNILICVIIAG
jgi:hypothetical protein